MPWPPRSVSLESNTSRNWWRKHDLVRFERKPPPMKNCRLIDVLELTEEQLFTLRETEFHGTSAGSVSVQHIRLRRHELERLHTVIGTILRGMPKPVAEAEERRA